MEWNAAQRLVGQQELVVLACLRNDVVAASLASPSTTRSASPGRARLERSAWNHQSSAHDSLADAQADLCVDLPVRLRFEPSIRTSSFSVSSTSAPSGTGPRRATRRPRPPPSLRRRPLPFPPLLLSSRPRAASGSTPARPARPSAAARAGGPGADLGLAVRFEGERDLQVDVGELRLGQDARPRGLKVRKTMSTTAAQMASISYPLHRLADGRDHRVVVQRAAHRSRTAPASRSRSPRCDATRPC